MFTDPYEQIEMVRSWNDRFAWGFGESALTLLEEEMPSWPKGDLSCLVLDVQLGEPCWTFEESWNVISSVHGGAVTRHPDVDDLSPLSFAGEKTITWQRLSLGCNKGMDPSVVRRSKGLGVMPGSSVMWAAALHPEWVRSMNGEDIPFVSMAGYHLMCRRPGRSWCCVPHLCWLDIHERVLLRVVDAENHYPVPSFAVPILSNEA